ncbi:MAG TPA: DNRLRE domain-containing protein [Phycisphaerae bacterium]|nr:DNRLRE domain-containing protein [Phycisphaerae bacterium]
MEKALKTLALLVAVAVASVAQADTVNLVASADALLGEGGTADKNFGASTEYSVQNRSGDYIPIIRFDLSGIAAGQTITNVVFRVEAKDGSNRGGVFDVYMFKTDTWTEGNKNNATADPGEVTWNSMSPTATDPTHDLNSGGILASVSHTDAGVIDISSAALTTAVQSEFAGDKLITFVLIGPTTSHDTATLYSREKVGFTPPTLILTTVPEPATMSLIALGGLAMLSRRRRG